jgi:transposase-like protein
LSFSFTLREQVKQQTVIVQQVNVSDCLFCHSFKLKKYGIRRNKSGDIQRFLCEDYKRNFSIYIGFEKMKHNPQAITTAIQLYFSGESLRNTRHSLNLLGVDVSHQTVYNWIDKYINLMKKYVEKLKPNGGDTWRADELWVKFRNDMKFVFALIDNDTRFWLAQEIADTKFNHDARNLFKEGKMIAGKNPDILMNDGLPAYRHAYRKEFYTMKPRIEHINNIKLSRDRNNKRMEILNNEIRSREKTMRGLK